jgi:hypothetical protein
MSPKEYAKAYALNSGLTLREWKCASEIIEKESHWRVTARNPYSGAYGLPQALPADKMVVSGNDYKTNPRTQIKWYFRYLKSRYRTPCEALRFHVKRGYY